MKKRYIIGAFLAFALVGNSYAQDDNNLVDNFSFEGTKGKLKRLKQINKAMDWFSPTSLRADLFTKSAKGTEIGAPDNIYGKEEPSDGDNYAGIIAYSYRGKDPRTYVSRDLKEKLKKGARYCVSYKVSLADLSKYAVNNLGAFLSKNPIEVEGKKDIVLSKGEEFVRIADNKVFEKRYSWETMCGEFVANGGERYITIGNFNETTDTDWKKLRKKKDFNGAQIPYAYYYIDEVVVKILEEGEKCECGEIDEKEIERVVYSKASSSVDGFTPEQIVANSTVYFAYLKSSLLPRSKEDLDVLALTLIENPTMKLNVYGHTTADEALAARGDEIHLDLASRRIKNVINYLKSHGLGEDRFESEIMNDSEPESREGTLVGKAKNRRVAFKLQN